MPRPRVLTVTVQGREYRVMALVALRRALEAARGMPVALIKPDLVLEEG